MKSYEPCLAFFEFIVWAIVIVGVFAAKMIAEGLSRLASGSDLFVVANLHLLNLPRPNHLYWAVKL